MTTGGYDLVVQVSEREYNDQLAAMYASGDAPFPRQVRRTLPFGEVNFLFDTPWLEFGERPQARRAVRRYDWRVADDDLTVADGAVTFCLPFSEASVDLTLGTNRMAASDIDGCLLVQQAVTVRTPEGRPNRRLVELDFTGGVDRALVGFTPQTVDRLDDVNPYLVRILRSQIRSEVVTLLRDTVERFPLAPDAIGTQPADAPELDPLTPVDVEAAVVRRGGDCLAVLLATHPDTTGDAAAVATETTGRGPVAVVLDSGTLLSRILRPRLAEGLGADEDAFAAPCRLRRHLPLPTAGTPLNHLTLTRLEATVGDGHIRVAGAFGGDGVREGWIDLPFAVKGTFEVRAYPEIRDGRLDVRIEADDPDVEVTAGPLGVLGAWVPLELVADIAQLFGESLGTGGFGDALTGRLGDGFDVPLGPAGDGLELVDVDLTGAALILRGRPEADAVLPVRASERGRSLSTGVGVDLDTGAVERLGGTLPDGIDLSWQAGARGLGLYAHGAQFAPLGRGGYRSLTVVDLEQAGYEGNRYGQFIPAGIVPWRIDFPLFSAPELVVAVRTGENRYAKCRVSRSGSRLYLAFHTYDRPVPGVRMTVRSRITRREEVESGTETWPRASCIPTFGFGGERFGGGIHVESESGEYTVDAVRRRITARARTALLALPLAQVTWTLAGRPIDGRGTVEVDGHEVSYDATDDRCVLRTELGDPLAARLAVTVVDDRGITVDADEWLSYEGTEKEGGMSPADLADTRDAVDRCMGPIGRIPEPGGAGPDPMPPWADLLDGIDGLDDLTQPGPLLDAGGAYEVFDENRIGGGSVDPEFAERLRNGDRAATLDLRTAVERGLEADR
jgi:hypothetical protein